MPIRVLDRAGVEQHIDVVPGQSLMEALRDAGVAAICGGMCSCATCHVYVHADWVDKLPPPSPDEHALLSELMHYTERSRLSCQIAVSGVLESLQVEIAPEE